MLALEQRQQLIAAALAVRQRAYATYSGYAVGAALLTADGQIITGCNVENASLGLTICAERAAMFTAVAQGVRDFAAIAIATADGGAPCGACRQVLAEFCRNLPVLLASAARPDEVVETTLAELLPMRFDWPSSPKS